MSITITPLLAKTLRPLDTATGTLGKYGAYADGQSLNVPAVRRLIDAGLVAAEPLDRQFGDDREFLRLTPAGRDALSASTVHDETVLGKRLDKALANLAAGRYFTDFNFKGRRFAHGAGFTEPAVSGPDVDSLMKRGLSALHRVLGSHILNSSSHVKGRSPIRGFGSAYGGRISCTCTCDWARTSNGGRADADEMGKSHIEEQTDIIHNAIDVERADG